MPGRHAIEVLRPVAVHRETAQLLELRAAQATTPAEEQLLRSRAAQRRATADQLMTGLPRLVGDGRRPGG